MDYVWVVMGSSPMPQFVFKGKHDGRRNILDSIKLSCKSGEIFESDALIVVKKEGKTVLAAYLMSMHDSPTHL